MSDRLFDLLTLLESAPVRERIRQMIDELGCIGDDDARALEAAMHTRLCGIAESLRDVCIDDDTTEALAMLPSIWLELRFEWMRYNMQMQYQTVVRGSADPLLMARGASLSYILDAVEFHLDAEAAFIVNKISADPVAAARGAIDKTDRLFSIMSAASAGGRDAVEALLVAQHQIAKHTDSIPVRNEMSKAISTVMERIGGALRVTVDDFMNALEGTLLRHLGEAPVRVVLQGASPNTSLSVPSAIANGLLAAAGDWMVALRNSSMSLDARERLAAGRPAYVTLTATLQQLGDRIEFILADDGDGTVMYKPDWSSWPIRDFKLHLTQAENSGSSIVFGCNVTSIREYVMLRVGAHDDDAFVGIPMHMVRHIERRDEGALAMQGTRLIERISGGTVPLVDLGNALFGAAIPSVDGTYVHVRLDETDDYPDTVLALRVRGVEGICRGSLRSVHGMLAESPLRGFLQTDGRIVAVVDFDRLLGRTVRSLGQPLRVA